MSFLGDIKGTTQPVFTAPGRINAQTISVSGLASGDIDTDTMYMLHFSGADESTTFTDEMGHTFTPIGSAKIDDAAYKFGATSGYFDGTGDYISAPASEDHAFGTGDFTVDFWMRMNVGSSQSCLFSTDTGFANISITYVTSYAFYVYVGGAAKVFSAASLTNSTWYHVAVVRNGTDLKMFVNGTQIGSTLTSDTSVSGNNPLLIGGGNSSFIDFIGWIDELRVSNVARWISNFTPYTTAYSAQEIEGINVVGKTVTDILTVNDFAVTVNGACTLNNWFDQSVKAAATPIFGGVVIADGGTVGQAGGPLIKFDDTSNYLLITGCKVGVGLYTSLAPIAAFHVRDIYGSQGSLKFQMAVEDNTAYSGSPVAGITFRAKTDATPNINDLSGISGGKENVTSGDVAGFLSFHTRPAGGDNLERLRITSVGAVGIGTTAPLSSRSLLSVATGMGFDAPSAVTVHYFTMGGTGSLANATASRMIWSRNYDNTDLMTLKGDGCFGIGTITPNVQLEVRKDGDGQIEVVRICSVLSSWTAGYGPRLTFHGGTDLRPWAAITGALQNTGDGGYGYLGFYTTTSYALGLQEKMRISANGCLGLQHTAPVCLLDTGQGGGIYISAANFNTMGVGSASNSEANFHINFNGYADSTSQFRNLVVNDGKHGEIANFIGSTKAVTFFGNVTGGGFIVTSDNGVWRSVNNAGLYISGGNNPAVGGHIILTGGTNSSFAYIRSAVCFFENVAGSVRYFAHNGSNFYIDTGGAIIAGNVTVGDSVYATSGWPGTSAAIVLFGNYSNWIYRATSSEKYKTKIERNWKSPKLVDYLKINPIKYDAIEPEIPIETSIKNKKDMIGFSAEEIEASGVPGLLVYDKDSLPEGLWPQGFLVYHHLVLQDLDTRLSVLEKK